jgi:Rrf2 family nitric oxide-sensitive transcriptional repressor
MKLTKFSDFSLRLLIYVAVKHPENSSIGEIGRSFDISPAHLKKIVGELGRRGYLISTRGRGGGIRLGREPEEINIGDLVRCTERNLAIVECFQAGGSSCRIEPSCQLKGVLREATDEFFAVLHRYTLADLVRPRRQLRRLLAISA